MRKEVIAAALGVGTLLVGADPAAALRCGPRAEVLEMLSERYDETRRGIGISGPTQVLEVYASESGTWTVLVTDPQGRSCLVASGRSWEDLREMLPPEGDAA